MKFHPTKNILVDVMTHKTYHFETIKSIELIAICPAKNSTITVVTKIGLSTEFKYDL